MPARSLEHYLSAAEGSARFAAHAQRLLRFQQLLDTALPPTLRAHARVANLRQGKLVVHAASSAVAAKLRQFAPRFTDLLLKEGLQLTEIDVRVQARMPSPPPKKREPLAMPSEQRKQALTNLAQSLPTDAALKGPLERLARTLKAR